MVIAMMDVTIVAEYNRRTCGNEEIVKTLRNYGIKREKIIFTTNTITAYCDVNGAVGLFVDEVIFPFRKFGELREICFCIGGWHET